MLLLWFLGIVFCPFDIGFYQYLTLPKIMPPTSFFGIIWIIIYLLNTLSIYNLIKNCELNNDYYFILTLNFIFCEAFPIFFFYFHNLILSLITTVGTTVTSYFLMNETKKINKTYSYYLYPYVGISIISLILLIIIFILN